MKKVIKISLMALSLGVTIKSFSQSSLYVSEGANFFITPATSVYIDGLQLKPSANFNIVGLNSVTRDATATPPPPSNYIQRVYHFLATTAAYSGDINFYYQDAELNGLAENTLNLSIYNGSTWLPYVPSSRDVTNNIVTKLGLASVSLNELTLTAAAGPVPVTLTDFRVQNNNCVANLKWKTASEQNSKHFELQQSTDGVNFVVISTVPSFGNSSLERNYGYNVNVTSPLVFFRLNMVDLNGQNKFSDVLSVSSNCLVKAINVYPVPTKDKITVDGLKGMTRLKLLDHAGQLLSVTTTSNSSEKISLLRLAAGNYLLQVVQDDKVLKTIKIVKE